MGVRKLYKFLKEKKLIKEYSNLTRYVNVRKKDIVRNNSESIVVAIDFWLYAHKFSYSYGNMVVGFWNQIIKLLSHKVIPIYIYDGQPPQEKETIINCRHKKRNNMETKLKNIYNNQPDGEEFDEFVDTDIEKEKNRLERSIIYIKKNDIDDIKKFFDLLNIPYLDASGEADALCAKLFKEGYITSCLSDDMDMLALGCGRTIKFVDGKLLEFDLSYILDKLEINYEQFVEMCIMFGCDYTKPSFKIDNNEIYELIEKYKSIDNILDNGQHPQFNRENEKCFNFINKYQNAKQILMNSSKNEIIKYDLYPSICDEIDAFSVLRYLKNYGQIDFVEENMRRIIDSIDYVNYNIKMKKFERNKKYIKKYFSFLFQNFVKLVF